MRWTHESSTAGEVDKSLIQRYALHDGRKVPENLEDAGGLFLVERHVAADKHKIRAASTRLDRRHGRAHTKLSRLVACSGYDPSRATAADREGSISQLGVVTLLNGCIKGIHVGMHDNSKRIVGSIHETG